MESPDDLKERRIQERKERLERERAREDWVASRGLKEFRWGQQNLIGFFHAAGIPRERSAALIRDWGNKLLIGNGDGVFDHAVVLGKKGVPTMLVSHPYRIDAETRAFLRQLRGMGLVVHRGGPEESFYGFGTFHVRVTYRVRRLKRMGNMR